MNDIEKDLEALSLNSFFKTLMGIDKAASDNKDTVYEYLKENYPADTLDWVKDAEWSRKKVSLSDIKMARRPGGPREQDKVKGIAQAFKDGEKMEPVVLVSLPDGTIKIADGYHRTLGCQKSGNATIDAWIGKVEVDKGKWDKEMHEKKLNVGKPATEKAASLCEIAFGYSLEKEANVVAGLAGMATKGAKGAVKEVKNFGKGITGSGVRKAKDELGQIKAMPNPDDRIVSAAKKNLRGERMNQAKSFGLAGMAGVSGAVSYAAEHKDQVEGAAFGEAIPKQASVGKNLFNGFKNEINNGVPIKAPEIKQIKPEQPKGMSEFPSKPKSLEAPKLPKSPSTNGFEV